jgi:hypothetical protein
VTDDIGGVPRHARPTVDTPPDHVVRRVTLSVLRRLGVLLLIALAGSGCLPSDNPSLERRDLLADPAANVRMPGADELAHFGREKEFTVDGPGFAFDSYLYGTQATDTDVISFFDQQLKRLGWTRDESSVVMGTTDLRARGWCKPRMTYRLAIVDKDHSYEPSIYRGKRYVTVFDAGLLSVRPDARCGGPGSSRP